MELRREREQIMLNVKEIHHLLKVNTIEINDLSLAVKLLSRTTSKYYNLYQDLSTQSQTATRADSHLEMHFIYKSRLRREKMKLRKAEQVQRSLKKLLGETHRRNNEARD